MSDTPKSERSLLHTSSSYIHIETSQLSSVELRFRNTSPQYTSQPMLLPPQTYSTNDDCNGSSFQQLSVGRPTEGSQDSTYGPPPPNHGGQNNVNLEQKTPIPDGLSPKQAPQGSGGTGKRSRAETDKKYANGINGLIIQIAREYDDSIPEDHEFSKPKRQRKEESGGDMSKKGLLQNTLENIKKTKQENEELQNMVRCKDAENEELRAKLKRTEEELHDMKVATQDAVRIKSETAESRNDEIRYGIERDRNKVLEEYECGRGYSFNWFGGM